MIGHQQGTALGRWQFRIAQILGAMVGFAFVFGFLARIEFISGIAIGFAALVVFASIFIPHLGRMALGVPLICVSLILGLGLGEIVVGKTGRFGGLGPGIVACAFVVGFVALLRLYARYSAWHLLGSLALLQAIFLLTVFPNESSVFVSNALGWNACISIPWVVGVVLGEIIVRLTARETTAANDPTDQQ